MKAPICLACRDQEQGKNKYLCYDCWHQLPLRTRNALKRTDTRAMARLQELYDQIALDVPLENIRVMA